MVRGFMGVIGPVRECREPCGKEKRELTSVSTLAQTRRRSYR